MLKSMRYTYSYTKVRIQCNIEIFAIYYNFQIALSCLIDAVIILKMITNAIYGYKNWLMKSYLKGCTIYFTCYQRIISNNPLTKITAPGV